MRTDETAATINTVNSAAVFERLYVDVRDAENRILSDEQVRLLPQVNRPNPYYKEWHIRKRSANRLAAFLRQKNKPLNILEIGCGNGWLSAMLADIPASTVTGIDVNRVEIVQAERVFKKPGLNFIWDDFKPDLFFEEKFDVIVFAASIQYFKPLADVLNDAAACLTPTGEIHIIDTHFYPAEELIPAAERAKNYYARLGYPEMANHYFQHCIDDIRPFNCKIVIDPNATINRVLKRELFYWVIITN